jgi:RNA polymerase sigma-70 factor (ECF subfamily)
LNPEKAGDLAQQAWVRVLRIRQTIKPGGNFPAYISTVAANLWRDNHRSAKRAGPLADDRLASLDAAYLAGEEDGAALGEMVADLNALQADEQNRLAQDIDDALAHLSPLLRDVVVSRLIYGESCLEIGRRYSRTQQTVSAWVRQGIREIKEYLERPDSAGNSQERP